MIKENEILLATGTGFYYEGVPQTSYNNYSEISSSFEDTYGESEKTLCAVQIGITVARTILTIAIILCILKGVYNFIKNRLEIKNNDDEEYDDSQYSEHHGNQKKKAVTPYLIASGVLAGILTLVNIVRHFAAKPIIYIYPEEEKNVKIKLKKPEKLTCTYPKYEDFWEVLAKPNGDLVDLKTNRKLYALYWEGINTTKANLKEGFVVEGENVSKFLEEKLEILGLNETEAEEFIVYWLPLMEKNKYNYIRFETLDEINENMGLEITPKPETLIRINMEFKGLNRPIEVKKQELEKVERKGYTVVEWGGTRL